MTDLERLHEQSFGWALSCCGWDHHMAEDVLQTTYVKVLSGAAQYSGKSGFRTWLFSVIRRTALEQARRARSRAEGMRRWGREARHPAVAEPAVHACGRGDAMNDHEDTEIRGAFARLRAEEAVLAPDLAHMLSAAEAESGPMLVRLRRPVLTLPRVWVGVTDSGIPMPTRGDARFSERNQS